MTGDDELRRLFGDELRRHAATLENRGASIEEKRRALHALKGAAGLVGETALSESIGRLERRVRQGDLAAAAAATTIVVDAVRAFDRGEPLLAVSWPTPPDDLVATPIRDALRATYLAEMRDRLARLDAALASTASAEDGLAAALRELHAMKGAAASAGDEVTTWFTHGLEQRLRERRTGEGAEVAMRDVAAFRGVLGELVFDPPHALASLRGRVESAPRGPVSSRLPTSRRTTRPPVAPDDEPLDDRTTRIPADALDRLVERVGHLGRLGAQLGAGLEQGRTSARILRDVASSLNEALRLIGPPRPWGAPAAALARIERSAAVAATIADQLDFGTATSRDRAEDLVGETANAYAELRELRRTRVAWLLDRARSAVEAEARRAGRPVRVVVRGGDLQVDRRLLEQLVDPIVQLARNSIAHGLESPEVRTANGKNAEGVLALDASFASDRLRVVVEDDGAGVDMGLVRRRAIESGAVPAEVANEADDDTLLELLFVPGFTTRARADALAGLGMGLDVVQASLRRIGGTIRLATRAGLGFTAAVEVPVEGGLVAVLWIECAGRRLALPARCVRRVSLPDADAVVPHLAALLFGASANAAAYVLDVEVPSRAASMLRIGVDAVGTIDDVAIRPLSPLVSSAGPYRGAVARPDGVVDLVLGPDALLELFS